MPIDNPNEEVEFINKDIVTTNINGDEAR